MKKLLSLFLVALLAVSVFAGCSAAPESTPAAPAAAGTASGTEPAAAPAADINTEIKVMTYNGATGLNPLDGAAVDQIVGFQVFDHLLKYDKDYSILPCLAAEWSVSDDGLTYTFKLAEGVKFHNGDTMTMDDVLFSLETYIASANGYNLGAIDSYRAVDDTTLEIVVKDVSAKLTDSLCLYPCIVSKTAYEADPVGFTDHPVGTGAYTFVERGADNSIVLDAFPDYFLGAPQITRVTFVQPMDDSTATMALESGEIDIISVVKISQIDTIEAAKNCAVFSEPGPAQMMTMFTGEPFLSNEKLRGAVYHAINPENVINICCLGQGAVAESFFSSRIIGDFAGSIDLSGRYDVEKAKQLLAESGFDTTKTITLDCDAGTAKLTQVIQADLAAIGLNVAIQQLEIPTLVGNVRSGQATVLTWEQGEMDMSYLDILTNFTTDGSKLFGVKNSVFDEIMTRAKEETNAEARHKILMEAYQFLVDHWMMYPYYDSLDISAYNTRIQGIHGLGVEYIIYVHDLTLTA